MTAPRRRRLNREWAVLGLAALVATACGASGSAGDEGSGRGQGAVTVSAAASLTDAFTEVADAFTIAHPGVDVRLDFGPSSSLVTRIADGAPVDVLAVADTETMKRAQGDGLLAAPAVPFARNRMQLITPAGNPGRVNGIEDLSDPGRVIALCAPEVPCGRLARRILGRAGVEASLDSEEPDVRSLLTKVRSGDVDAAIVYRTDALAAGDVVGTIDLPAAADLTTEYPIAALQASSRPDLAAAFVDFVLSEAGQKILRGHGFERP